MHRDADALRDRDAALQTEWLLADGAGGYASMTVLMSGARRYHGLWVPALAPPVDRRVVLAHVEERLVAAGAETWLSTCEYADGFYPDGSSAAERFALDPLPRLTSRVGDVTVERTVLLRREPGAGVVLAYHVRAPGPWMLDLAPFLALRPMHALAAERGGWRVEAADGASGWRVLSEHLPGVFLWAGGHAEVRCTGEPTWYRGVLRREERRRGFDFTEDLLVPGRWHVTGRGETRFHLAASFEPPHDLDPPTLAQAERERRGELVRTAGGPADARLQALVAAADAFLVRRRAGGRDLATVIAGYPWFADWGRDAMIALPGLAIETGRLDVAAAVLEAFAEAESEGMIPNRFAERSGEPEYNTVDASLWFLQAVAAYLQAGGDTDRARDRLWPAARAVCERYASGTRFGIRADSDGLIRAGSADTQLTWMDATSEGRPVTPRYGKPVEINALWASGLELMGEVAEAVGEAPPEVCGTAAAVRDAFAAAFWNADAGCLYDCIYPDGRTDAAVRPNQGLAVGLPFAPLSGGRAKRVLEVIRSKLLTPRGLRTLAPDDPAYRGRYEGTPAERDAAYHQGTVWPWLLGPYVDAAFAAGCVECARAEAAGLLAGLLDAMEAAGLGEISEIFDGDPPHRPRGCIAQAWSVAAAVHIWQRLEATGGVP